MRAVEASAKTREEAIQIALKELGVEMYEVDKIEILDEGSRGLFGFGVRPVRVRVVVEHLPDLPAPRTADRDSRRPDRERHGGRDSRRTGERGRAGARGDRGPRGDRPEQALPKSERGGQPSRGDRGEQAARPPRSEQTGRGENRPRPSRPERGNRPERRPERPLPPRPPVAEKPESREEAVSEAPVDVQTVAVENEVLDRKSDVAEQETFAPISDGQGKEAAALLEEIIRKMGIEGKAVFSRADDGSARLNVESPDGAILIGRKGRNLSALQYIVNRMISRGDTAETSERILVDVEGYVERCRANLEGMARGLAQKAKELQRSVRLKPMTPQERRIIHLTLQDDPDVRTFSLGESLYRSVVISPKNAKPESRPAPPRGRSPRGRGGRSRHSHPHHRDVEVDAGQFGD